MNLHIKIRGPDLEVNLNIAPLFWERLARERVLDMIIELVPPITIFLIQALTR